VEYLARSPYEWSHHIKIGYGFGVSDADIETLIAQSEGKAVSLDAFAGRSLIFSIIDRRRVAVG
jgi:hypothetical protein